MRLKFEKGMTPERIADYFVRFIRDNKLVIGAVNVYIQAYDENMKPVQFSKEDEFWVISPGEAAKIEYIEDVACTRRKKIKAV